RGGLDLVPAYDAAGSTEPGFVLDDPRHLGTPVEIHPTRHDGVDRAGHVPHIVAPHLTGRAREPVREFRGLGIQQQPWRLDRVAGYADRARLLLVQRAGLVGIDYARNLALVVVIDLHHHAVCPNLEPASALGLRDLGIEARPFSADGAARHAET